ncbi:MAG: hypothetical protein MUC38_02315 [Cyclobacteriaceae bacterium]|jgi:hypothetical protein|nr:hypothetical protein [Cyclobacteriaceae bacterium]
MKGFWLFWLVAIAGAAHAQVRQLERYEREVKPSDSDFTVIPMQQNGLALVHDKNDFQEGKRLWEVILLDTALAEQWVTELYIENRLELLGYEAWDNQLYLLYRANENDQSEMTLIQLDPRTHHSHRFAIKQEINFRVSHFSMANGHALFGGYIMNEPSVFVYDLAANQLKIVPGFFQSEMQLMDLRVNYNNTFNVVLVERTNKQRKKRLVIKTFDDTGAMLLEDVVELDDERVILSALISRLQRDELLVAGTWGARASGTQHQAYGYFSYVVDPFTQRSVQYYDFPQLAHFLDYEKPRRAEKIKAKAQLKRKQNRVPNFRASVNLVALEEYADGFALQADQYMPTNTPNQNWNTFASPWYNPYGFFPGYYPNTFYNRPFGSPFPYGPGGPNTGPAEIKMLSSSVAFFSPTGQLNHDYQVTLKDMKVLDMKSLTGFAYTPAGVTWVFKNEKDLRIKYTDRAGHEIRQDTLPLKTNFETEEIRSESRNDTFTAWYPGTYVIAGNQTIHDHGRAREGRTREVFYLVKVKMQ